MQPQDGDKANVTTTGQNQQADVDVNQSSMAPKIQYTSDKAKVVIKQRMPSRLSPRPRR